MAGLIDADTAAAFCGCAALAATLPLVGSGTVPAFVRIALALTLSSLLVPSHAPATAALGEPAWAQAFFLRAPLLVGLGAACGLCAALVANAAAAAGAAIDVAIAAPPTGGAKLSGTSLGPFGSLYSLGYGAAMFGTGAATRLIGLFVEAAHASVHPALHLSGLIALASAGFQAALALAAPALFAQALGTIAAAVMSRVAGRSNGMLTASAIGVLLVMVTVLAGSRSLFPALAELALHSAGAPRAGLP
jgi:flagellar biosynthesis protein FliR